MTFEEELLVLIKTKSSLIYIVTSEEERLEYTIRKLMISHLKRFVYTWDFVNGFKPVIGNETCKRNPFEALNRIRTVFPSLPSIFVLKDFENFFSDLSITREIKNIVPILRNQPKTIIFLSQEKTLSNQINEKFIFLEFSLPTFDEIERELLRLMKTLDQRIDQQLFDLLVASCQGLSLEKIRYLMAKSINVFQKIDGQAIQMVLEEKQQKISQTGILEFWQPTESLENIGGLDGLKSWLSKRRLHFTESAKNYRLPIPKGIVLVGVQGTGKSMMAKAIAHDWVLPLLRLDSGRLFGGLVGESEKRMRDMIEICESLAPCILWIDEMEKSLSTSSQTGDSGTSNRILSTLLTWLAEKKAFVFVVATANNLENLQLELIRKGRFDEIFFLDLPSKTEREKIFEVHLKHFRPESWFTYNLQELSQLTPLFSGAEIRQLIIEAMYQAFAENRDFHTQDIIYQIENCIPLAKLNQEGIQQLQKWARSGRIRPSSTELYTISEN